VETSYFVPVEASRRIQARLVRPEAGGHMRKYIFSGTVLGALFGGWSTVQATRKGPRDWRLPLMWISWGLTVAVAIGTVKKNAQRDAQELER
jgi:hypothetical protein